MHETESQLILSGSRQIDLTMELVLKDIGLFQAIADRAGVALDANPLLVEIFRDGARRYGRGRSRTRSCGDWRRRRGTSITAPGFPAALVDDEPKAAGHEVRPPAVRE